MNLSGDQLPRIAAILTGLDADYTLDADPQVLRYLAKVADRAHQAAAAHPSAGSVASPPAEVGRGL